MGLAIGAASDTVAHRIAEFAISTAGRLDFDNGRLGAHPRRIHRVRSCGAGREAMEDEVRTFAAPAFASTCPMILGTYDHSCVLSNNHSRRPAVSATKKAKSQPLIDVVRQAVVQQAQELFAQMTESFARGYTAHRKRVAAPNARARKKIARQGQSIWEHFEDQNLCEGGRA
jgi:hypothetical protein